MFGYKFLRFCSGFFILIPLWFTPTALCGQSYLWPTTASKLMTSSFCEFRPRHYHAAIDIKTWNRTGYRTIAIEDGYVIRARVSAFGYGKAVYLKLKDGNIAVYAHLDSFWPELEKHINDYRQRNRIYRVDLEFPANKFPVKRGQLIGYTGKTGIGSPHLHFEIRDGQNRPINPLQFYPRDWKDGIAPQLYEAAFFPMDHQSLINQQSDTLHIDLLGQNRYVMKDTLLISGRIGVAVKSYDRAEGASNQFSFYRASMWIDDSLAYSVQYDQFSYAQSELIELEKNFSLWRRNKGIFHNFYRHRFNTLPHYDQTPPGGGIIDSNTLPDGIHRLKVQIEDYNNNTASLECFFRSGKSAILTYDLCRWLDQDLFLRILSSHKLDTLFLQSWDSAAGWSPLSSSTSLVELFHQEMYYYTFAAEASNPNPLKILRITGIQPAGIPTHPLYIHLSGEDRHTTDSPYFELLQWDVRGNWIKMQTAINHPKPHLLLTQLNKQIPDLTWFSRDEKIFQLNLPLAAAEENSDILARILTIDFPMYTRILSHTAGSIISGDGLFRAHFPAGALYDEAGVTLKTEAQAEIFPIPKSYRSIGAIYDLRPFDQPVKDGIRISLAPPDSLAEQKGIGLYYWDFKKGWLFIPTAADSGGRALSARVTSMERFTLIQDTLPPVLTPLTPVKNNILQSTDGEYRFLVKDEMSGIQKESQITIYLDDQWQLFEYDPEEDFILIQVAPGKKPEQRLRMRIEDNSGNVVQRDYVVN